MALISRGTKSNTGTTSFGATENVVADLETDLSTIVSAINGNLDNTNIVAAAGIAISKLATINPEDVDDHSTDADEQDEELSPGSYTSRTLATSVRNELKQLRYQIAALGGVLSAVRYNGANDAESWIELPAKGPNLVANGNFAGGTAAGTTEPIDWTVVGSPSTLTVDASSASSGEGYHVNIQTAGSGVGIRYTVNDKLKPSTRYLISYRAALVAGGAALTTTGGMGSGEWQNIASGTQAFSGSSFASYKAVVATDATPTALVLNFLSTAAATFYVKDVSVRELGVTERPGAGEYRITEDQGSLTSTGADASEHAITGISITETVPSVGYVVRLTFNASVYKTASGSSGHTCTFKVKQDGTAVGVSFVTNDDATINQTCVAMTRLVPEPTAGSHTYTVTFQSSDAGSTFACANPVLYCELIPARMV